MKTTSKQRRRFELLNRLVSLGFTYEEAESLRRIEMTLHRWAELECGDGNDYASWGIERDETTGKPYLHTYPHNGPSRRRRIPDREKGALKRLAGIIKAQNERDGFSTVSAYHQTDPRGCALYILRIEDRRAGVPDSQLYTNGIAVCD